MFLGHRKIGKGGFQIKLAILSPPRNKEVAVDRQKTRKRTPPVKKLVY